MFGLALTLFDVKQKPEDKLFENSPDRVKKLYATAKGLRRDKARKEWKDKHNGN